MNELKENECLPNLKIFGKFEETTHTQKYARIRTDIDFERFPLFAHWRGSQK